MVFVTLIYITHTHIERNLNCVLNKRIQIIIINALIDCNCRKQIIIFARTKTNKIPIIIDD